MKTYTLAAVSFILAASVANGCTSSTTSTSSGSSSGGSSSGGSSSGGSSSGGSSSGGVKQCAPPQQQGNECPQSEIDAYAKCATDNCDAEYKECYGANYQSGSFGGPCGTYITCTNACECNDTACYQKCQSDQACTTCSTKLGQCITSKCKLPCQAEGKTCDDVATCCAAITDATKKSECEQTYNAIKSSGDAACNAVYEQYKADCE